MHQPVDPVITTRGLTKRYGPVSALEGLDLDVPAGSVFGFLGPNGAGKTTTLKILAGLTRPTAGTATVAGVPASLEGRHRRMIGYLAQDPRYYDWMTGREILEHVARLYPDLPNPRRAAGELLDRVGIADAADRRTSTYSGGMRQRLGIAQALIGRPAVVILDEPAASLDPLGRRDVLSLLRELAGETTVLYSTHILDDVERVSDHVAILDRGRLITSAPTAELLAGFTRDTIVVALGGAGDAAAGLAGLPGVTAVRPLGVRDGIPGWEVAVEPGATQRVQAEVTAFAAANGYALVANAPQALDLETVFLRLIDHAKEVAA